MARGRCERDGCSEQREKLFHRFSFLRERWFVALYVRANTSRVSPPPMRQRQAAPHIRIQLPAHDPLLLAYDSLPASEFRTRRTFEARYFQTLTSEDAPIFPAARAIGIGERVQLKDCRSTRGLGDELRIDIQLDTAHADVVARAHADAHGARDGAAVRRRSDRHHWRRDVRQVKGVSVFAGGAEIDVASVVVASAVRPTGARVRSDSPRRCARRRCLGGEVGLGSAALRPQEKNR